jgi:SAM-dependent methyltransferase
VTTQAEFWKGQVGDVWARIAPVLDPLLAHFGHAGMDALGLKAGDRVLDVGCGAGATSRELAQRVGPRGQVVGVDISRSLLEAARSHGSSVRYVEADAATATFDTLFDIVFSRFGVMFFEDPVAAFANIRRAAPRGRLGFVCWRSLAENDAMRRPSEMVQHLLPPPAPSDPHAPGPFAFADSARIKRVLADSGWKAISVNAHDSQYALGATAAAAVEMVMTIGPLARTVRDHPELEAPVRATIAEEFGKLAPSGPLAMRAGVWIVTARA